MKKITLIFMLLCSLAGFSQLALENFEGAVWPPDQWSIYSFQGPQQQWELGSTATGQPVHSPTHSAYMQRENVATGTTTEDFLVTKPFTMPAIPQLRFWSVTTIPGNQLNTYKVMVIGASEDASVAANYDLVEDWSENDINPIAEDWNLITVGSNAVLNNLVGQQVRLAFVMMGDNGDRWAIDDIEVVTQCLAPTTLTANNISLTEATLSWANPSGATSWEIEIVAQTTPPTGSGTTISQMPYVVTGLAPSTCYKYYVRAECTATNESTWAGPFNFCTVAPGATCNAPSIVTALPFSTTNNTANFGDHFDGTPGNSGCGTTGSYLNGDDVVYSYTATANGVISIDATALGEYAGMFVYDDCADIGVNCIAGGTGNPTTPISIPTLSVTAGTTYYIVISTWATPQSTPYTLVIQQVNCAPPVGLPTTGIGQTSVDLSWTNPSGATSWEVVVQAPGGGIPPGAGTTANTNTNYPVTGLTPATPYEYWVRAACGNGTFSAWAGPYLFNTTICEVADQCNYTFVMTDQYGDGWNGNTMTVSQNGIAIAVIGPTFTDTPGDDHGPVTVTVPVCNGLPLQLYWNSGGGFSYEVGVRIQNNFGQTIYNMPFDTEQQNTLLYTGTVDCATPACLPPDALTASNITTTTAEIGWAGPATGTWEYYIVPEGDPAPTASTAGVATSSNPVSLTGLTISSCYDYYVRFVCSTTENSEWAGPYTFCTDVCEATSQCDYTFNMISDWWVGYAGARMVISQNGTPVATIGQSFTTGPNQSVTIPLCSNIPFEVYWDQPGTSPWQVGLTIVNNFGQTLFNMAPGSGEPGTVLFTTDIDCSIPACLAPEDLAVANITTTTADLSWAGPATGNWEYIILPAGSAAPTATTTGETTTTNPVSVADLTIATNYEYYVRVVCSPTQNSPWAGPFAFNTTPCEAVNQCNYVFEMTALSWGWNGNTMTISQGGVPVATIGADFTSGTGPVTVQVPLCDNMPFEIFWNSGPSWSTGDVGLKVYTPFAEDIFVKPFGEGTPGTVIYSGTATCMPPLCPKPQNLSVTNIEETSVQLNWSEMSTATSWEIEIVEWGAEPTGTGTVVATNPYTWTTGLESGTTYEFYVRALCGGTNGNSTWSGPKVFTTAISNDDCADAIPVAVNPGIICLDSEAGTITGATSSGVQPSCMWMMPENDVWYSFVAVGDTHSVSINDAEGATFYIAVYGSTCGALTEVACQTNSQINVEGLTPGETYYVQVYATWIPNPTAPTSFEICIRTPQPPIIVTQDQYTVNELVTEILVGSECAAISNITSSTGSDFGQANGIGYFTQGGSSFPIESGVVLVGGGNALLAAGANEFANNDFPLPNPGWAGDADLEAVIGLGETNDATYISFDFESIIDNFSFDFLFASEEYNAGGFECTYSDSFAFILTDLVSGESTNLAVIPNTETPILVTNIHPDNGVCPAINEEFFGQYNNSGFDAISFNGQVVMMTANSAIIPNHPYNIKLVVANQLDHNYPSAVFLKEGSFNFGEIDLGAPRLEANGTAACDGETITLNSGLDADIYDFVWKQDGVAMTGQTGPNLDVTEDGLYSVEASFEGTDCKVIGEVRIEFFDPINQIINDPLTLEFCDNTGFASFDLEQNTPIIMDGVIAANTFTVTYHLTEEAALNGTGAITSPFTNTVQNQQTLYVRVESVSGCVGVKSFAVKANQFPQFTIPAMLTLCGTSTGTITVQPGNFDPAAAGVSFSWTLDGAALPDTGNSVTATGAGVYEVTVNNSGCTTTASTTVTVSAVPTASIAYSGSPYCSNGTTAAVTFTGNTGGTYTSAEGLVINPATGEINLGESTPGSYTVAYDLAATPSCDAVHETATVVITPYVEAEFAYDAASFCTNYGSIVTPSFDESAAAGMFTADNGFIIDPATGAFDPAANAPGIYNITNTVAAANGCSGDTATLSVTILAAPIASFSYGAATYCQEGTTDPSPILNGVAGTFGVSPDGLIIDAVTGAIDLSASQPGTYTVTNSIPPTSEGCDASAETMVVIGATPVFVFLDGCEDNVYSLEVVDLEDSFDINNSAFAWTGPEGFTAYTPAIEPTKVGDYTVTIVSEYGCTDVQTYTVKSTTCFIQKGISPGDGGQNNNFDLTALDVKHLSIFNRYGQEVYSLSNYTNEWGGQDKSGNELPSGTYFYSLERDNGETKTGWVYINRQN